VSTLRRPSPLWINFGAIAVLAVALVYVLFWPGPQGLPLIKVGIPQRIIALDVSIIGINDADLLNTVRQGREIQVSINNGADLPMTIKSVQTLPRTVVSTQSDGTVKPMPDPRPEMKFSNNLLLHLEGQGYSNKNGIFIGLKRTRVGATVRLRAPKFDGPGSIVDVTASAKQ
jgi:Domain of unknown function (DUF4330)